MQKRGGDRQYFHSEQGVSRAADNAWPLRRGGVRLFGDLLGKYGGKVVGDVLARKGVLPQNGSMC
eukprot:3118479-Ditylum_brightwellii.AAC.1